jgi:predicted ATPase/class 3 adenylate cyclase
MRVVRHGQVAARPSGTVTFLFTDIEGSTVRWERDPDAMGAALTEHDDFLRSTIEDNGGTVFSTGGDGFAAAFADAASALQAAVDGQGRLGLPVRMGLHTGSAEERDGNYFGRTLNRTARIMSAGHGGQILLSDVTAGLVRDDVEVTDLGEHRLAGVETPMRLWQVGHVQFPPLRTVSLATGNLPVTLDSFVGRTNEFEMLSELVKNRRLVTVVGVGGMGKTRLVVEAFHRTQFDVPDGVWFVDLSLAQSDSAVVDEVASLFGLQASPGRSVEDRLVEYLESKTAVVVFDNCEHVMRPTATLIDLLLHTCPMLKIVATSREALMLRGEHVMPLGPLSIDAARDHADVDSVALFLERVIAEGGSADVDEHDRGVVLDICRQLDGMPLAIELAAARARTLGVVGVLARLGESLRLLSGGWRTGAGRQRTLSATLDWSYVLLDEREQAVFDHLSVFVGWFTLDDGVAVVGNPRLDDVDVLDVVSGLVDKSMCTVDLSTTPARYRYLETMRSYGRDHLSRSGTLVEGRKRHAGHFAATARRVRKALVGPDELDASREAERLVADLRAALGWAVEQHLEAVIDDIADLALVMAVRGAYEMSSWCHDLRDDLPENARVQAVAAYHALFSTGDLAEMRRLCERTIELTDGWLRASSWMNLGFAAFNEGRFDQAVEYNLHAYELGEDATDELFDRVLIPAGLAIVLGATGRDATDFVKLALDRAYAANWPSGIAYANYAAGLAISYTDPAASLVSLNRAVHIAAGVGNRSAEAVSQTVVIHLQSVLLPPGELAVALIDLLRRLQHIGDTNITLLALSQVVELLDKVGRQTPAALICGWLDGRSGRDVQTVGDHDAALAAVRQSVGAQWDELLDRGRSMTSGQIIDHACDELAAIG